MMKPLTRENQIKFYKREIEFLLNEYELYFKTNVEDLRKSKNLFLGIYIGSDKIRGNIVIKFRKSTAPALKVPLLALKLPDTAFDFASWKNVTYENLRSKAELTSEVLPIFIQKHDNDDFIEVGFSQAEVSFLNSLVIGQYVVMGRKEPPINYYLNLIEATKKINPSSEPGKILDNIYNDSIFSITNEGQNSDVLVDIEKNFNISDVAIVQGPPGTGKTTFLAEFCNYLLENKKSVLVTALTNSALIELVKKEKLSKYLSSGKISKTNLNTEEYKECYGLKNCEKIFPANGELMITTYYKMTGIANETNFKPIFDCVILEEASQSFLGTIACARALGRKLLIVGDHMQLPPVVTLNNPSIIDKNIDWLIYGLKHFASKENCFKTRLIGSYRLLPEAVKQTGVFYENSLRSLSNLEIPSNAFINLNLLFNPKGGSSIYFTDLKHEGKSIYSIIDKIIEIIKELQSEKPNVEIAILTAFRKSRNFFQDKIFTVLSNNENITIETIDRIQGLTCDFTFFIIPYDNPSFSFNINRFNVATSRARYCTLIITDEIFKDINPATGLVAEYWKKLTTI
jgi:DNA replication ATP-dependent helicase Dna2